MTTSNPILLSNWALSDLDEWPTPKNSSETVQKVDFFLSLLILLYLLNLHPSSLPLRRKNHQRIH